MDIREITPEEKKRYIDKVKNSFEDIRKTMNTLEVDMENEELMVQATSVWISGQLCNWWSDFITQIKEIDKHQKTMKGLCNELMESDNDRTIN